MSFSIEYLDNDILLKNKVEEFVSNWNNSSFFIETKTSGSTGKPKIIRLSKTQMITSAKMTGEYFGLSKNKTSLLCLSIDTIAGKMMIVRAIVHQMKLLVGSPQSNPLIGMDEKIDFIALVPLQVNKIINESLSTFKSIESVLIGGASIPQNIIETLKKEKLTCFQSFGMTETVSHIAIRKVGFENEAHYTTLHSVKIESDEHNELIINAPHLGINNLKTNDLIEVINKNQFIWKGRKDFVINSGGIKLFPEEIERKLSSSILNPFFITSFNDSKLGEKVVLIIESKDGSDILNEKTFINLDKYERPKEVFYLKEFIKTESGKINRIKTKALLSL